MLMKTTSSEKIAENCVIDWQSDPHLLVSGRTSSGKSTVLENILLSSMSFKKSMCAKVYIIDGKGSDLSTLYSDIPVAVSPNQTAKMLRVLTANMHKRYERFSGEFGKVAADYHDTEGRTVRQVVLIIDELAVLLNDVKTRSEIQRYLFELLIAARQASIYVAAFCRKKVVVGIQRPSAEIFPRDTSLQFNNRILLAPNSTDLDTKRMLFPMTDSKALPLTENIRGAGLFYKNEFLVPQPVYFPDMSGVDIPRTVKRINGEVNENWFIKEEYWKEP